jgi:hypothetical protein
MNCAVSTASNACAVCASTGRNASRPASASLDRWAFLSAMPANQFSRGELAAADPATAGRAVFDATARFHNPTHAPEWSDPSIDAAFEGVRSLVLRGLGTQVADGGS